VAASLKFSGQINVVEECSTQVWHFVRKEENLHCV
jgi:hypothetical protein